MAITRISQRVNLWKATWESRHPLKIVRMYAANASHSSGLVEKIYPEAGGPTLRGEAQIGEYFRRALARFNELEFRIASVTEQNERAAIEYRRHSNVDGNKPAHVLELVEWNTDGLIEAVRVFHA